MIRTLTLQNASSVILKKAVVIIIKLQKIIRVLISTDPQGCSIFMFSSKTLLGIFKFFVPRMRRYYITCYNHTMLSLFIDIYLPSISAYIFIFTLKKLHLQVVILIILKDTHCEHSHLP